jgi:hypothetical protein
VSSAISAHPALLTSASADKGSADNPTRQRYSSSVHRGYGRIKAVKNVHSSADLDRFSVLAEYERLLQ